MGELVKLDSSLAEQFRRSMESMQGSNLSPQVEGAPGCPVCGATGFVGTREEGFKPCGCNRERRVTRQLPERYRNARIVHFAAPLQDAVIAWMEAKQDGLLLTGPAGAGKTHLAAAIVRLEIEQGRRAIFRRSADLYAELRDSYRSNLSEKTVLQDYLQEPLLVLDDVGAGGLSDHERRATLEVLDVRLNNLKPTVVTTNWALDQIAERLDDRIASRLAGFARLELTGQDRRLK